VRRVRPGDDGADDDVARLTPSERVSMVWQLTLQAWMFKEGRLREPRLRRDVVRTRRERRWVSRRRRSRVAATAIPGQPGISTSGCGLSPRMPPGCAALRRFGAPLLDLGVGRPHPPWHRLPDRRRPGTHRHPDLGDRRRLWPRLVGRLELILEGVRAPCIGRDDLLANKRALGRPQDLADIAALESRPTGAW